MQFLTFDPSRLRLLLHALENLRRSIDACMGAAPSTGIHVCLRQARELVDVQISRVEASLRSVRLELSVPARFALGDSTQQTMWTPRPRIFVRELVDEIEHWAETTPHWWTQATKLMSTRSDDLLDLVDWKSDPGRAGSLIDALTNLEFLVLGTVDLTLVESLWTQATDPTTTSSTVAGHRIRRLIEIVFDERPWEKGVAGGSIDPVARSARDTALRELVARVAAPWQLDFTSRSDWGWSAAEGARRLHQISELESGANTLLTGLSRALHHSLAVLPEESSARIAHIDGVSQALGTSLEVHRMSDVDRARSDSDFDTLRDIMSTLAIDGPWPISILIDAGADWIGEHFDTSRDRIDASALESLSQRQMLASVAVVTVFTATAARSSRSPTHTREARLPPHLASELRYTYQSIDNAAGRGQTLAQLTSPR